MSDEAIDLLKEIAEYWMNPDEDIKAECRSWRWFGMKAHQLIYPPDLGVHVEDGIRAEIKRGE